MKRQIFGWSLGFGLSVTMAAVLLLAALRNASPAEAVARRDPASVTAAERELILNKIREGDLHLIRQDLEQARRAWADARRMGEGLWPIHEGLGDSYARAKRTDDALREYAIALSLIPDQLPLMKLGILSKRAVTLDEGGRSMEAIQCYLELDQPARTGERILELALRVDREAALRRIAERAEVRDARLFLLLAELLDRLGRKIEAAEALAKFSLAVAPWDEAMNRRTIEALRGAKRTDRAVEICRAWAKASPGALEPYRLMGDLLREAGREKEAIVAYTSIVGVKPGDAAAHRMLGGVFREMNRLDDAIAQYEAAKKARPEDEVTVAALVSLYESKGDAAKAERTLIEGVRKFGLGGELRTKLVASYQDQITRLKAAGKADEVRALRRKLGEMNVPEAGLFDLKVIMTWDARSDVDLDIIEPGGEHVDHGHAHSKSGGHYYVDNTQGFGPETYTLPSAAAGAYRIGAHLHGNTRSTVKFVVILYEDTPREERREYTTVLESGAGPVFLPDLVLSK